MRIHWVKSNYVDPSLTGTWVYYVNPNFPDIHFSHSVDNPKLDHMATNDGLHYYYGVTKTFQYTDYALETQLLLIAAWRDYFPDTMTHSR